MIKWNRGVRILWKAYLLEKAMYEHDYEFNNRPHWAGIPVEGISEIMGEE
jgi:predicted trehalose synthase